MDYDDDEDLPVDELIRSFLYKKALACADIVLADN